MDSKPIHIIRRGQTVSLRNVPPERTLLEVLREDLGCAGTKEGCGEGDCGACTVVVTDLDPAAPAQAPRLRWRAINSCIRPAHSIAGMALWTVEDLAQADGVLHPAQQALLEQHGSQCGFCTPGFVMSLFGTYQNHVRRGTPVTRELAQHDLSGNLCRCTGYRPILDAAQQMSRHPAPAQDEATLTRQLQQLARQRDPQSAAAAWLAPTTLQELLTARAVHPRAQIVAGATDVGLWITKQHRQFDQWLDVTRVRELQRIEHHPNHLAIGAAVTLHEAFSALLVERPGLHEFAARFAGLPVRNAGTLGGNVANGSPIGDSMPLLIALNASVVLMSVRGHRELALEDFYTGYRRNVLAGDEVLAWIKVPRPTPDEFLRAYKVSKRQDDDISAVCLVLCLQVKDGRVAEVSIGAGGVAATPARATQAEAALRDRPWDEAAAARAGAALRAQFQPISDMRASAAYRGELLANLMRRCWLASQRHARIDLYALDPREMT